MKHYSFIILALLFSHQVLSAAPLGNYQDYNDYLSTNWPISSSSNDCHINTPAFWKNKAEEMISVLPLIQRYNLNSDEVMVLRNLLVSQAYNRLFTYSLRQQKTEHPQIQFYWIAAGSQASATVGHALQVGLSLKYSPKSRPYYIFKRLEDLQPSPPLIPAVILSTINQVKKKTAENNWRVYSDIAWQHLAYLTCGRDEVIRLNNILIEEEISKGRLSETEHYERFIQVWNNMDAGNIKEANEELIYIEQYLILQRYMYDGLDAKMANGMLIFNQLAKADLTGPKGRKIKDFNSYSIEHGRFPNLGSFPTRFPWMKYVVSEQASYLEELSHPKAINAVLTKSLYESYRAIHDLETWKN